MPDRIAARRVEDVLFADALGERYLAYALSTITSRSLPDVRDGLKPVQRRLLHAMRELRLDPGSSAKKCARIVGDVIGKYHPHGDAAVYDALVRLAQDFAARYPLVEGQGNFGNLDGDNAAAMRYTEARLTDYAVAMIEGIDEDTVDIRRNYDGSEDEPAVLPARVPNLLCNGASGIAVGMATSIPPHNLDEVCAAALHLLKFPNATVAKLAELVPGPDFPGGGRLVEDPESVVATYAAGRGAFRLRARWRVEELPRGQYQVVVTEIPYQVQKGRLVSRIADLMNARKLPLLGDMRDESAEDTRLVLEPRSRSVAADLLMEHLFRTTDLEVRVPLNMNVLEAGTVPRVMTLKEALRAFLDHREDVLVRRARHRLGRIARRIEVLEGLLVAYLHLDEVIRLVREEDQPKPVMTARWGLSDVQADAVLDMRLRALRRLEEVAIREEHAALSKERAALEALVGDARRRTAAVAADIRDIRARFGKKTALGRRRTEIAPPPAAVDAWPEALVAREPVTVTCSAKGWIRAVKGRVETPGELRYKEGDGGRFVVPAHTTDRILVFATNGRFYTLAADKLPGGRGHGEPLRLMIDLPDDQDVAALLAHRPGEKLLVASLGGRGFVVPEDRVVAQTRSGKQVLNLGEGDEAAACAPVRGDSVAVVGENRRLLVFALSELPEMTRGRGVRLQSYRDGGLADATTFDGATGLAWRTGARTRTETGLAAWTGKRGQAGRPVMRGFPRSGRFGSPG